MLMCSSGFTVYTCFARDLLYILMFSSGGKSSKFSIKKTLRKPGKTQQMKLEYPISRMYMRETWHMNTYCVLRFCYSSRCIVNPIGVKREVYASCFPFHVSTSSWLITLDREKHLRGTLHKLKTEILLHTYTHRHMFLFLCR